MSFVFTILSHLPKPLVPCLTWFLAALIPLFSRKESARFDTNVDAVLGLPAGSHFALQFAKQTRRHQVACMLETIRAIREPAAVTVTGLDELKTAIGAAERVGKGHLITTAHLGSWELVAYYGRQATSKPFHVLAKPSRSAALTKALDGVRKQMGVDVLWTDKKSLLRDMLGALKRGESVGFVMDQKPEGRQGPVVKFFDRPTEFVSGPAQMAIRNGSAVIGVYCLREGPWKYRLTTQTLVEPGHTETDELAVTQRLAASIERTIRIYPEQWTWSYKRWRFNA